MFRACVVTLWAAFCTSTFASDRFHLPDGFEIELAAGETLVRFPMFATFDDRGRLFVAESSGLDLYAELQNQTRRCRIRLLEDTDRDGRFDRSIVFAEKLVFPMGLVWRDEKLYVADPPDLVAFEDLDNDGTADRRNVLLSGFGHTDNGSLHGLTFGPDGLLYMTMGEPDGYRFQLPDGSVLEGKSGALIRCRPDGSNVEVLARGFENLIEVVFTPDGDIIGTDNWFQRPSGGIRDALVHLVEGGLYPYAPDIGTPQPVTGQPLPALSLFPAVALSGLARYEGSAFPQVFRGNLFSAQHNSRAVGRHVISRSGATFASKDEHFLTADDPDFHPSDVLTDADGTLLVVDTGSWYVHHCPTGRIRQSNANGGVYRITSRNAAAVADPWGLELKWTELTLPELTGLLADPRPAVRTKAQRVLIARGSTAINSLIAHAANPSNGESRLLALWTLANHRNEETVRLIRELLKNGDLEIASAAARIAALWQEQSVRSELEQLLDGGTSPQTQLAAAIALARCGNAGSVSKLWAALARDEIDRFLEHALVYAAHHLANNETLTNALHHSNTRVRVAALRLLDQPSRPRSLLTAPMIVPFLSDHRTRDIALSVLKKRTEWTREAVSYASQFIRERQFDSIDETGARELILAFQHEAAMQSVIAQSLAQGDDSQRKWLLNLLAESSLADLPVSWVATLDRCLSSADPGVRLEAARSLASFRSTKLDATLLRLAESAEEPIEIRLEAIRTLQNHHVALPKSLIEFLIDELDGIDPLLRLRAVERLRNANLSMDELRRALTVLSTQQLINPFTLLRSLEPSSDEQNTEDAYHLIAEIKRLLDQGISPEIAAFDRMIEHLPAGARAEAPALRRRLKSTGTDQSQKLAAHIQLLQEGRPEQGRAIFFSAKTACSVCHRIGSEGGNIGPDLTKIGAIRSGVDLLESILFPSSTFAQGYETFVITTERDERIEGMIIDQDSASLLVRDSSGAGRRLARSSLRDIQRRDHSLMPDGLDAALTQQEFRDLLAFLQELK